MDLALAPETLARWQFGITTVYHFLFIPLTISLSAVAAGMETAWVRTGRDKYFHATKFWGKLFLINIAMGVVTGLVQEFQFGMNWSAYSRFVGDVFGAPLAMEALIAFFFESTFIGLWIFGWDKLPKRLHCACIWIVSAGTVLSAYFVLAANSWMQHPNGYTIDPHTHRARLTGIWTVLTQNTTLVQGLHTLTASFLTGAAFVVGISSYHLWRTERRRDAAAGSAGRRRRHRTQEDRRHAQFAAYRPGARGRRRSRGRGQRRRARQGDVRAAADEDGRRRGAACCGPATRSPPLSAPPRWSPP